MSTYLSEPTEQMTVDDATRVREIHIAPPPYDRAYCGMPRDEFPLLDKDTPVTCVVCLDLAGVA